jgi:5'-methylthioadenosine phosphorylase
LLFSWTGLLEGALKEIPVLAVIGGSGLYDMPALKDVEILEIDTPFGSPSSPITVGTLSGQRVAFLARHGIGHHISPSEVNYRANIFALKMLGVQRVVGINACGSLRDDYAPGHIVIPDQVFDFTRGRARTFFGEGLVVHIGTADPFCKTFSAQVYEATLQAGGTAHLGGNFITIEGPRFSTRAESHTFRAWGMSVIGMTTCPEVFLALEAEMCYACMAHVTDYDVWHVSEEPVTVDMVIRTLFNNTALAQKAIQVLVEKLSPETPCDCQHALQDAIITHPERIPVETRKKLGLLVDKYLVP